MLSITIIFTVIVLYCIFLYIKRWRRRIIIDKMPGPKGNPIIGSLSEIKDNVLLNLRAWSKQYYPIYKYWFLNIPVVNLLEPSDIEIIMGTMKHSEKGFPYDILHPWLGTGLLTSKGSKWHQRRKILTPAFHFNILQQFLKSFREQSDRLVKQLEAEVNEDYTNIVPIISQSTLESICETAMGTQLDKNNNKSREYINAISDIGEILLHRITRPWLISELGFFLTSLYRKHNKCIKILHDFVGSVIKERQINFEKVQFSPETNEYVSSKKQRLAMLDLLISAKNTEKLIDDKGIQEEVNTFMFEGHDTTTACISFTLFALDSAKSLRRSFQSTFKQRK